MRCPSCETGILHQTDIASSAGRVVVCDNSDCFTFFNIKSKEEGGTGEATRNDRLTDRMQGQSSTPSQRRELIETLKVFEYARRFGITAPRGQPPGAPSFF